MMPFRDIPWGDDPCRSFERSLLIMWAAEIVGRLNDRLPDDRFRALPAIRTRLKTEEWVGSFEFGPPPRYDADGHDSGELYPAFDLPPAQLRVPARFSDRVGVNLIDTLEGPQVGAAVHFVCPDHKADSDGALALAVRCAAHLTAGAGIVVIDTVTGPPNWATHLHSLVGVCPVRFRPPGGGPSVLAVRPAFRGGAAEYDVWHQRLVPGEPLPTVPLAVRGAMALPLDLEATFTAACDASRVPGT